MSAMEEYNQEGVEAIVSAGKPIPGQSLTTNPDAPRPFEGPTEYTKFKDALDYVAAELLQEEVYTQVVLALGDGVSVTDMATQIGYVGFREGKWNPDLMLLLMEPLMYLLMSLCEKEVAKAKIAESSGVPAGALPQNIVAQVEAIEMPQESLLAQPAQPEAQPQESLLDRG